MEMLGRNNELFKNVFPDYQSFKSWYQGLPLSENDFQQAKKPVWSESGKENQTSLFYSGRG